ncbi:hypothetical protein HUU62_16810 [Rhodoferax sp. 4810]|nr:hypothetical protein [Rhodoferax jenense]
MKHAKHTALIYALAGALTATPFAWAQTEPAAPAEAAAAPADPSSGKALLETHTENADVLKGLKSVAVASFQVYVLTEFEAGSTAQGGSSKGSISSTHSNMKVTGLEAARLQALTDELYAATLDMLKAKGFTVYDPAALQALPAFVAWKAASDKAPYEFDGSGGKGTAFAASGLPLLHVSEMGWLHRTRALFGPEIDDPYVSLGEKMGVGFRMTTLQPLVKELATAAQMPLLHVRLVLAPGGVSSKGGGFFSNKSETQTTSTLALPIFTNRFMVTTADGSVGRLSLNAPLLSEQGLGELVDVTSTAETAGNIALAAFSILASANGYGRAVINNSRKQELRTSPDIFEPVARAHAKTLLVGLTDKLSAP